MGRRFSNPMKMNYYRAPVTTPELLTLAEAAFASKSLATCSRFLSLAGLDEMLNGSESFTVFAPTDEAFRNLPAETLDELTGDPKRLREVLQYHIINGGRQRSTFANSKLKTLQGALLTATVTDDGLVVDHASTCGGQVTCANGVIHPIDAVLMPGYTPVLSAEAREESAWSGKRRHAPQPSANDWPFVEPRAAGNR